MTKKVKEVKGASYSGRNVRINDKSYKLIKNYCDKKGYRIGVFFELGALEKMRAEVNSLVE